MDTEIKTNSTKKLARLEKKKKKMIAFLEIARLNDHDRELKEQQTKLFESSLTVSDEPSSKKTKTENGVIDTKTTDQMNSETSKRKQITPAMTPEEVEKLRQELRDRRAYLRNFANFKLKSVGEEALLSVPPEDRTPIFLSDVQHLILFSLLGVHSPYIPNRWSAFDKQSRLLHTVVIIVENFSLAQYKAHESSFQQINSFFHFKLELMTPSIYKGDLVEEIAAVPLTTTQKHKLLKEYGSLEKAMESAKVFKMLKAVFPVREEQPIKPSYYFPPQDKFPRTHLLLSAWQMVEENYPVPLKGNLRNKYSKYILTKDCYEEVTPFSPMFAMDCEMCKTTTGQLELTRISVVNEKHEVIYEKLVKPYNPIVDYLTRYSGITRDMLRYVNTRIEDVQKDLRNILPGDAILVGQSLNSDLHALRMMHPYVIDSSVVYNITGDRYRKTKLKFLAKEFLNIKIQDSRRGHDSIEDSLSSLKLVQLKLQHYIEFGDAVLSGQTGCLRNFCLQNNNYYGSSLLHNVTKGNKKVSVVARPENIARYSSFIHKKDENVSVIERKTKKSIMKEICEQSTKSDFILGHISLSDDETNPINLTNTCRSLDKLLQRLSTQVSPNALCILVFGGNQEGNGACFVQIKKAPNPK